MGFNNVCNDIKNNPALLFAPLLLTGSLFTPDSHNRHCHNHKHHCDNMPHVPPNLSTQSEGNVHTPGKPGPGGNPAQLMNNLTTMLQQITGLLQGGLGGLPGGMQNLGNLLTQIAQTLNGGHGMPGLGSSYGQPPMQTPPMQYGQPPMQMPPMQYGQPPMQTPPMQYGQPPMQPQYGHQPMPTPMPYQPMPTPMPYQPMPTPMPTNFQTPGIGIPPTGIPQNGMPQLGTPGRIDPKGAPITDANAATRELARNFDMLKGPNGKVTTAELQACVNGSKTCSPEMRNAASYILANPTLFTQIETADAVNQGRPAIANGEIGEGDINVANQKTGAAVGEQKNLKTLMDHSKDIFPTKRPGTFKTNECLSRADIQKMADGGKMPSGKPAPPDVQHACREMLNRPDLMRKLDTAAQISAGKGDVREDGLISLQDLKTVYSNNINQKQNDNNNFTNFNNNYTNNNFTTR